MKLLKRAAILAGIFLAAVGIYLVISWNQTERAETVYTLMEAPSLPVVYAQTCSGEANRLVGFTQEMGVSVARESLVILQEDRSLPVEIREYGAAPLSVSYEIRSLDGERLVERAQADLGVGSPAAQADLGAGSPEAQADLGAGGPAAQTDQNALNPAAREVGQTGGEGVSRLTLQFQNLISRDTEYLLHIQVDTELHGQLNYYTRILWPTESHAQEMLALAREFSVKTFDEAQAATLVTYLETTDTADNSSLGDVSLKSSFSQITWAGLHMEPVGEMRVTLTELDGIMGQVRVTYQVSRQPETGQAELYDVEDYYTMRWDEKRIYMMDFKRTMNEVFSGRREAFSGKRILLGIGTDAAVSRKKSDNGRYLAFVFNRELWLYDQDESQAVKLFSFRLEADDTGRSDYDRHDIRILAVNDDGNVDFLVYGYMNRGVHEGSQGISICRYDQKRRGAIEEMFYIPSGESFDELRENVELLCHLSEQNMLYLYLDRAVFAVDLTSDEYLVVAQNLVDGAYAISSDGDRFAWQDSQTTEGTAIIHLLNLDTGGKQEIAAPDGAVLRTIGFVQGDFVYGLLKAGWKWYLNGRMTEPPMYAIEIVDDTLSNQSGYEPEGLYISNVSVEEGRIHLDRFVKTGDDSYEYHDSDTIVCNTAADTVYMEGIGWYASEDRRKLYFIQLDQDVKNGRGVRLSAASGISYDGSERLDLHSEGPQQKTLFYAYGRGKLQGIYTELGPAADAVYDLMGIVTDADQRILWDRVNRPAIRGLKDPQALAYEVTKRMGSGMNVETDGLMLLECRGMTMRETLYYIGMGWPVLAYTEGGSYLLLYGYDQYNVSVMNPETGERYKLGLNDATAYFEEFGNDFVCAVQAK